MAGKIVGWGLRLLLAVVLAIAGAAKVSQPETFAIEVDRFQLTPWSLSLALAYFLPWLEIVTALGLFVTRVYLGALLSVSMLGIIFTVAVGSAWWRGLDISCGCFGALVSGHVSITHVIFALLLAAAGGILLVSKGLPQTVRR